MEIPIEKKRLFRILNDIATPEIDCDWTYAFVYHDDEAVQVLKDLGFVELKAGNKILDHISSDIKIGGRTLDSHEQPGFVEVHLKNEFITQVGLALFREHETKGGNIG